MKFNTKNVCICLDEKTIEILDRAVEELREAGNFNVTKSALVRFAIQMQDKNKWADLPRTY